MFTRKSTDQVDETMSGTYKDENITMGDIFDNMWTTDTSPVFFLTMDQEDGLKK